MQQHLSNIAELLSGVYTQPQPDILANTLYLQGVHFNGYGQFNPLIKPQIRLDHKTEKHLLQNGDILFAAKGLNNFAVEYSETIGQAVASSSFIRIKILPEFKFVISPLYLAWYLTNGSQVKQFHKQLGSTIPSISITKLSALEINIPSLEKQELILQIQTLRNQEKQINSELQIKKDQLIKHQLLDATK